MKTIKKVPLKLIRANFIPPLEEMKFGEFYFSEEYSTSNHLCVCGCGQPVPLPIGGNGWSLSFDDELKITVSPSILLRLGCKSHYIITNGVANIV